MASIPLVTFAHRTASASTDDRTPTRVGAMHGFARLPLARSVAAGALASICCFLPPGAHADGLRAAAGSTASEHAHDDARTRDLHCRTSIDSEAFARTELFFGLSRPGGVVTEEDFKNFVDARVTPRFPDGLTLLAGNGQFQAANGTIVVEGSKLLILLYPRRDPEANRKIEQIRTDYKYQFQQQSVLRTDDVSCVSF